MTNKKKSKVTRLPKTLKGREEAACKIFSDLISTIADLRNDIKALKEDVGILKAIIPNHYVPYPVYPNQIPPVNTPPNSPWAPNPVYFTTTPNTYSGPICKSDSGTGTCVQG